MRSDNATISIIIPVFNGESFIEAAFRNILDQNLKDFEKAEEYIGKTLKLQDIPFKNE